MPYVVNSDCVVCGACVSGCEVKAISEGEAQCHIDPEVCIECGTCEANCPCQAISFVEEPSGTAGTQA
jgi:ferredoxin